MDTTEQEGQRPPSGPVASDAPEAMPTLDQEADFEKEEEEEDEIT